MTTHKLNWKIHTPNLLSEILNCLQGTAILLRPLQLLANLLGQVAQRASELNDPQMNALMCRLTLYAIADQEGDDYDKDAVDEVMRLAKVARNA